MKGWVYAFLTLGVLVWVGGRGGARSMVWSRGFVNGGDFSVNGMSSCGIFTGVTGLCELGQFLFL